MSEIPEKNTNHYIDNKAFLKAIIEYKAQCAEAEAAGLPRPRIPEYIGGCLLKISTKFSFSAKYSANFIGYPFREDMVMDGVETCVRYFHNFDPTKFSNPLAYFTQIIYYSFLNRIQKEKKYLYTRFKAIQNQREVGIVADSQEHEELSDFGVDIQDNNEYMNDYIRSYEKGTAKQKDKKKKKAGTLDVLDEFEELPDIDAQE
jgi:hypothetical protein